MIANLFQSVGIVLLGLIVVIATIALIYLSYVLAIGVIVAALIFITYHVIATVKNQE